MAKVRPYCYVIDTSSIIHWYVETYAPDIFPKLPERIDALVDEGRLLSPEAVRSEIRPGDNLHKWAKRQNALFLEETEEVQKRVARLMRKHHNSQKPHKGINGADPFVIAMARELGANWTVVCNEHPGSDENRKIPYVCAAESVDCINFQDMMRRERWQFK